MLDSYVPRKDPSGRPIEDYVKPSDVEILMESSMKTAVEVTTRLVVTGIGEGTIKGLFTVVYDKPKEEIETSIRYMVERAVIVIVEEIPLDTNSVLNVDKLSKSTRFMDA